VYPIHQKLLTYGKREYGRRRGGETQSVDTTHKWTSQNGKGRGRGDAGRTAVKGIVKKEKPSSLPGGGGIKHTEEKDRENKSQSKKRG